MKIIKFFLYTWLLSSILAACIKDHSTGVVNAVSKIEMAGNMDTAYSLERYDTLKITAPECKQTHTDKPLSYSWEIDYKEVSKDKNLVYRCMQPGRFAGRLKVSNEDGFFYKNFEVEVRFLYSRGLYVLSALNDKSILSYYADGIAGKNFITDIYESNNPLYKLGTVPKALFITNSASNQMYMATGNPAALYRIDANTMLAKDKIETESFVTHITDDGVGSDFTTRLMIINNGRVAQILYNQNLITNPRQQAMEKNLGTVQLFDKFYFWKNATGATNGELYFDNLQQRMLMYSSSKSTPFAELFAGTFTGQSPIGFCHASNRKEFVGVFKNNTNHTIKLYWFNPGFYNKNAPSKQIAPEIKYSGSMPESSGITAKAVLASSYTRNVLYYSGGNKVYAYSILSKGNFPTSPLFTCGNEGETVAAMLLSKDETKLYVGTNAATGQYKGSIYCYHLTTNTLLWAKKNVTGDIKQLDYRYN